MTGCQVRGVLGILRNGRTGKILEKVKDVDKQVGGAPARVRYYVTNFDNKAFRGEDTSIVVTFTSLSSIPSACQN